MNRSLIPEAAQASTTHVAPMLVVAPCGRSKIWDREPDHGPVSAAEAYTGTPFQLNHEYAERFGDAWVVLRTDPCQSGIKHPATDPISMGRLHTQVRAAVGSIFGHCRFVLLHSPGLPAMMPGQQQERRTHD